MSLRGLFLPLSDIDSERRDTKKWEYQSAGAYLARINYT
jgi:hypothetical protein